MKTTAFALIAAFAAAPAPTPSPGPEATEVRVQRTRIDFDITPADVEISLDGRRLGKADQVDVVSVRPGRRVVRLERNGDTTELELVVTRGKLLRFAYDFGD